MDIVDNQVHIWKIDMTSEAEDFSGARELLSEDEHKRADKYKFQHHQNHFVRRRYLLRNILSKYCHCKPDEIKFKYNTFGKPFIDMPGLDSIFFSTSFSADLLLVCVASKTPPGIDIEKKQKLTDIGLVAFDNFSRLELYEFRESTDKETAFFKIWTRKEAFVKAIGEGLHFPLNSFSLREGSVVEIDNLASNLEKTDEWKVVDLDINEDYVAALAIKTKMFGIRYFYL
ncbi:MAG: 4'-phosphopantetheinyl transferase superfamily protein [Bacteroidota bacterium]|nr:4'-phosphopantetheinyl transferase superfamily protein [Bacteroidota bacterium]